MRKIIVVLCTLLTVICIATTVSAASSASISLSANDTSVGGGDKVTITVKATVDQCSSGGIEVSYDTKRFELISGEWLLDSDLDNFDEKEKNGVFAIRPARKITGKVFQLVIKVKNDAPLGKGSVTFKFKADEKIVSKSISIKVTCSHKYSNSCDTSCNLCGATRKISHSWNNGDIIKAATCTDTGSAKFTCTVCKETKTDKLDKTSHTYDHNCDTDCNVCGATREITHVLVWACDATDHWMACSVCGHQQDKGAHTLDTGITSVAEGHGVLCTTCNLIPNMQPHTFDSRCDGDCADCGYQRTVNHYYGVTWYYDAQGHWQSCMLCGNKTEPQAHVTGQEVVTEPEASVPEVASEVVQTDLLCTVCGFIVTPAPDHAHLMAGEWISDENGHRYPCYCGEESDAAAHNWDEGKIDEAAGTIIFHCTDCDYAKAEIYIPEPTNTLERILAIVPLWMLLSAGLGVSVIVNVILIVCVAKSRRKLKENDFLEMK